MHDAGMKPTLTGAAKLIGIKQPSVSEWKEPGNGPELKNCRALALKLGVCVEWLYTEEGPKNPPPRDAVAERIWALWPQLDQLTKGRLLQMTEDQVHPPGEDGLPSSKSA